MEKLSDIAYKVINKNDTQGSSRYEIKIKGNSINSVVVNTIRRSILTHVPTYAFNEFNFTTNETIFNNNYIKLRLKNMPVWGIDNTIEKYDNKKKNVEMDVILEEDGLEMEDDIDLENNNNNLNSSSLSQLTMYVDHKSTSKSIITVTTDHAKFYYDGENIQSPYKIPIPIIKLQPGQSINFSAITNLGTEKINPIYSAVCVCFYKEINKNEYDFIIESRGQLTEQRIIEVGLINLISSLENIYKLIPDNQDSINHMEGEIIFKDENHTLGNLLSHGLQNHKDIAFSGYHMTHFLEEKIVIEYKLKNEKNKIKNIINDVIIYYIELYKEMIKLNKKI